MKSEENRNIILSAVENEFEEDKSRLKVYGFTKLGILETARAKKGIRLSEFVFQDQDAKLLNIYYYLKLVENKCLKAYKHYKKNDFEINITETIFNEVFNILPTFIEQMKIIYGISLNFNSSYAQDDFITGGNNDKS
jgi:ribonuclease G